MNIFKKLFASKSSGQPTSDSTANGASVDIRSRFAHLAQLAVHLRPASETAAGFSKFGGLPLLPPDANWPEWNGKPLAFLAQIDLAEINACLPSFLPKSGCLYFFYDQQQSTWGFDPKDAGSWRVLYTTTSREHLAQRPAPAGLDKDYIYKEKLVVPHRLDILPDAGAITEQRNFFDDDRNIDSYCEFREMVFEKLPHHQMLGHPSPIQSPDMELECQVVSNGIYVGGPEGGGKGYGEPRVETLKAGVSDWKLLLQLDTDDGTGWMWGDCGTLYFWIREQDAARADFSNVWMILQCY